MAEGSVSGSPRPPPSPRRAGRYPVAWPRRRDFVAGVLDGHGHNGGKISKWVAERLKAKLLVTPLHPATAEARPALLIFF